MIDYNPSDEFHWIYDEVLTRDDCDFFQTTYKDNPYLSAQTVAEIERFKEADPDFWRVYGLGERGVPLDHPNALETGTPSTGRVEAPKPRPRLWLCKRPDSHRKGLHRRPRLLSRRSLLRERPDQLGHSANATRRRYR